MGDVELTGIEMEYLVNVSTRERPILLAFGTNVCKLVDTPSNEWAHQLIRQMRCQAAGHGDTWVRGVGRCIREVMCRSCGCTWTEDSSD